MEERCKKRTIAFYARVSTEHEAQVNAFENQLDWGKELLKQHPEWTEYHTYYDKGITGTSTQKRPGFMKMLSDAKRHKSAAKSVLLWCDCLSQTMDTRFSGTEEN